MSVATSKSVRATVSARHLDTSPCAQCSSPVEPTDAFCASCGAGQARRPVAPAESARVETAVGFKCENCGAQVRCDPGSRTTSCPFCSAPYVVELEPSDSGRQAPEFVIGFSVSADQADEIYRKWLRAGGWFRPGELWRDAQADGIKCVYLPFWSFSLRADSRWSAQIGEHWYRTETYTERDEKGNLVTKTRQVQETEWWPLQGGHHSYYSFHLVSGSKGLPQAVSEWIRPFELLALKRYAPQFLAGWLSEEYSIEKEQAFSLTEREYRQREVQQIAAFMPGDTHTDLVVDTAFSNINSDLILLPIYLRSYVYRGKLYRTLINGQTGKIAGEKPVSLARVGFFVLFIALIAFIIYLLSVGVGR